MYDENLELWCCALLLFISPSESLQNFTSDKQDDNSIARYKLYANFIGNYDNETEFIRNNDREDDLIQYGFSTHFIKYSKEINQMSMKLEMNFTKIDNNGNSNNENDNKNHFIPYEMCDNITCIQLCCPLGNRLIDEFCIAGTHTDEYIFPKVYNDLNYESKRMDEIFQLIVRNPCEETRYVPMDPNYSQGDKGHFKLFANGSLYFPFFNIFVESTSYCLAVLNHSRFMAIICEETINKMLNSEDYFMNKLYNEFLIIILSCRIISMLCLLIMFLVYSILPELRNIHSFTLRRYSSTLLIEFTIRIMFVIETTNQIYFICIIKALVIYFCSLASVFWLNVMSFDMWWTFRKFRSLRRNVKQQQRKKLMYSICVWGGSFILTIICIIMELIPTVPNYLIRPGFDIHTCWFSDSMGSQLYFYWPKSICIINSICLFISTALKIACYEKDTARHLRDSESRCYNDNKQWFNLYLKLFIMLFILMAINWIMSTALKFLEFDNIISWMHIVYSAFFMDTIQHIGFLIIFVCKKTVMRLLVKRFCQNRGSVSKTSTRSDCYRLEQLHHVRDNFSVEKYKLRENESSRKELV